MTTDDDDARAAHETARRLRAARLPISDDEALALLRRALMDGVRPHVPKATTDILLREPDPDRQDEEIAGIVAFYDEWVEESVERVRRDLEAD